MENETNNNITEEEQTGLRPAEDEARVITEETEATEITEITGETPAEGVPDGEEKAKKPPALVGYEWLESFALALSVMVLIFLFAFKYVTVDGSSMNDTLYDGERLIITSFGDLKTGDIVVLCEPGNDKPLVKRVIATGGQTVHMDFENWKVYVNGIELDEPYVRRIAGTAMKRDAYSGDITVPEGYVFVMGDNRNHSTDSRHFGCVDERAVLGRVIFRITPFSKFGAVD